MRYDWSSKFESIYTPHAAPGAPPPLPPPPLPSPPLPPSPHGPPPRLEPVVIVTMANTLLRRILQRGNGSSTAPLGRALNNYFGNASTTTRNYTKQHLNGSLWESYDYYCFYGGGGGGGGSGRGGMLQDAHHRWRRQGHLDVCPPLSLLAVLCGGQVADFGGCRAMAVAAAVTQVDLIFAGNRVANTAGKHGRRGWVVPPYAPGLVMSIGGPTTDSGRRAGRTDISFFPRSCNLAGGS